MLDAADYFDNETMMSVSTFSGSDTGEGNYLNVLVQPINVIENSLTLYNIIQSDVPANEINDTTRDPGAAIRDALISLTSPDEADILYLVSRRYVDGGPIVKELDIIETLLESNTTLICVEGTDDTDDPTNKQFNLDRFTRLMEGYYFTNNETSWQNITSAATDKLIELSKEPNNYVRRTVIQLIPSFKTHKLTVLPYNEKFINYNYQLLLNIDWTKQLLITIWFILLF